MLSIKLASINLKNPLILASGVVGSDVSLLIKAWQSGAAAVVTKTYTIQEREGFPTPIIVGLPYGYINAVGLENPGIKHIPRILKNLRSKNIKTIVSITGRSIEEFLKLAMKSAENGAVALELNLSCPHAKKMGLELGMDQEFVVKLIRRLKEEVSIPIFPKFGYMPNLIDTLKLAQIAGADGVVLINTIRAMKIDVWIKKPILSNRFGGLSGPALHPIAVYCVYQAYENLDIPIIASGGVWSWEDVVEFLLAGATAVQIGSALAEKGWNIFGEILQGLEHYLRENNFKSINEIIGLAHI